MYTNVLFFIYASKSIFSQTAIVKGKMYFLILSKLEDIF